MLTVAPTTAAAALDDSRLPGLQDESIADEPAEEPIVSVPGVASLWIGEGFSLQSGVLGLPMGVVDLPAINATATVNGFTFGLSDRSTDWDTITVQQAQPAGNETLTIAETQATVGGKSTNNSADVSTRIEIHPSDEVQMGATLGLTYDGLTGQAGVSIADGSAQVAAGPAAVGVEGLNVGDGAVSIDTAQVVFPDAATGLRLDGFSLVDGQADWQALTWFGQEFNLGNALTFSDNLVSIPGPSAAPTAPLVATTNVTLDGGDLAQAQGQLVFGYDPTTGQPNVALRNGRAIVGVPGGWAMAVDGFNAGQDGASMDTLYLVAEPIGVQTQVSGLAVDSTSGPTFEQARFLYQPTEPAEAGVAGFELVVDNTAAGYVVSTTTLLPKAQE
jgi:hypothetical protein